MIHVRLADRTPTVQAALALLELLVGLLAILGTVITLLAAALAAHAVRAGVSRAGGDPAFGTVGAHLVALAALLLVLASIRFVVVEHRRFLDRAPGPARPILFAVGPLVGVAVPFGYAAFATDSLRPPWLLLGVAVVSAHALAYRALSAWSRTAALARLGELAGVVAGIPMGITLVTLLTEGVLFGPLDDAGRLLLATPGWGLIPRDGLFLVAFPLFVTTAFGVYRLLWRTDRVEVPDPDLPRVGASVPDDWVRAVERRVSVVTLTDVALAATDRLGDYVSDRRRRTDGAVSPDAPPVPTPIGTRQNRSDSANRDAHSGSPREGVAPGPRPPVSPSSSSSSPPSPSSESGTSTPSQPTSSGNDTRESRGKRRATAGADGEGADADSTDAAPDDEPARAIDASSASNSDDDPSARRSTDEPPSDGADRSSGESSSDESVSGESSLDETVSDEPSADGAVAAESHTDGSPSDAAVEADDSQTRIYTPDAEDAAASGGAAVETCPECEADVPSDGTYVFCPLCGHEL